MHDMHLMTINRKPPDKMRTDKTGATSDEDSLKGEFRFQVGMKVDPV